LEKISREEEKKECAAEDIQEVAEAADPGILVLLGM
jgi:hypothetical protein